MRFFHILAAPALSAAAILLVPGNARADYTYTFDNSGSFTATESGFTYNPAVPNFRFDYGTAAGSATHGATFTTISGNGAVQVSEAFNYAAQGGDAGSAYTIDLFPSPSPTNITNIAFDIRLDPSSAKDSLGGAGYLNVATRDDGYGFHNTAYAEEFGNPSYSAPTAGTYEHISIPVSGVNANVRALTLSLYNDAGRAINGTVVFDVDNLVLTTAPEPASLGTFGGLALLLARRRR